LHQPIVAGAQTDARAGNPRHQPSQPAARGLAAQVHEYFPPSLEINSSIRPFG
jgi:hypothetical protein